MIILLLVLLLAGEAQATTYYVNVSSGSDANTGTTEAAPWATIQKCVNPGSPMVAGDTCLVKPGTYTDTDGNGITVYASSSATTPSGTASAPITIKSETPLGAVIMVRQNLAAGSQVGFYISKPYYVIEGFEIDGRGTGPASSSNTQTGIAFWGTGGIARYNEIHHIGREFCSNSVNGMSGIYVGVGPADVLIEYNEIYSIGRLRGIAGVNENGCALTPGNQGTAAHDHGVYASQAIRLTIRRNVFWDTQRGYPIHIYRSSATSNPDVTIEHNTIHGLGNITGGPTTQLLVNNAMANAKIRNNLFSAPKSEAAFPFNVTFSGTSVFSGNRTTVGTWWKIGNPTGIDLSSQGTLNATMGFTNAGASDFSLTSSSGSINTGVATGAPKSGAQEDVGAFEAFSVISAVISGQTMDISTDAVFLPLQALSTAGWSVSCTGTGCGTPVVGNITITVIGNTIRLTITGITGTNCAVGQTWTVTYNSATGNVTDSIRIGGRLNQPMHSITTFAVTNACSGSPPPAPGGMVIRYEANEGTGTTLVNTGTLGTGSNGTLVGGTWGAGQQGTGVVLTAQSAQYGTVPYGSGFNYGTTSQTVAFWVHIDAAITQLARTYAGTQLGTDQRVYISQFGGNFRLGIKGSNDATAGNIAVTAGLHHLCLEMNHATTTATLYVDGVASTAAGAVKSYAGGYTAPSNWEWGRLAGSANGPGGTFDRFTIIEDAGKCGELYAAESPAPPATTETYTQQASQWEGVYHVDTAGGVEVKYANGVTGKSTAPGAIALLAQIRCDNVAPCPSTPFPLYYSLDGVTYSNAVPDVATADGVYMYGASAAQYLNTGVANGPIVAGLTHVNGSTTTLDTHQSQSYAMNQNTSLTIRAIVAFTAAAVNKTFYFRFKRGAGVDLDTYTVSPALVVGPPQANGGS